MTALLEQTANLGQLAISSHRRLPVDGGVTTTVQSVSGESVQFYYYNSTTGALTIDAGQAAGTVVVAKLVNKNIKNSLGDIGGLYGDTSFSFGTGTVLTTLKPFRGISAEENEMSGLLSLKSGQGRANAVTSGFNQGNYCIDHEHGVIYGVKATSGTSDTGSYKTSLDSSSAITSIVPGTGATNLGKAEDAVAVSGDTGVMMLGVRNDAMVPLTSGDGDYSAFAADAQGAIYQRGTTNVVSGTGSALNATPIASSNVLGYGYIEIQVTGTFVATLSFECSNDDTNWFALNTIGTTDREPFASTTTTGMYAGPITGKFVRCRISAYTSGTVNCTAIFAAVSNVIPAIECFGNVAHNTTDAGNPLKMGGYASSTAPTATVTARRVNAWFDLNGRLATFASGDIANDAVDSGNPVKVGFKARQSNPTAVADADRVDSMADDVGRQVIVPYQVRDLVVQQHTQIAGSTSETTILTAGAAGVFHDVLMLQLSNASATATDVTIRDQTGGSAKMIVSLGGLGSNSSVTIPLSAPWTQGTSAQNWTAQLSSGVPTVNIFIQAAKNV